MPASFSKLYKRHTDQTSVTLVTWESFFNLVSAMYHVLATAGRLLWGPGLPILEALVANERKGSRTSA